MTRAKLYLVSDIHVRPQGPGGIPDPLATICEIVYLALNDLCGRPDLSGEALHRHLFCEGGAEVAAARLSTEVDIPGFGLGFSAGGTILWRAAARGVPLLGVFCISSTRLRDEGPMTTPNQVFFGGRDPLQPPSDWLDRVPERSIVHPGATHDYYSDPGSKEMIATYGMIATRIRNLQKDRCRPAPRPAACPSPVLPEGRTGRGNA